MTHMIHQPRTLPSERGYQLWNTYLNLQNSFERGYDYKRTRVACSRKTYAKKKELGLIETFANVLIDSEPFLISCFLASRKFSLFDLVHKSGYYEEYHNKRLINLEKVSILIKSQISDLKSRLPENDLSSALVSLSTEDLPLIYKLRFDCNIDYETIAYINHVTNFLNQESIVYSQDSDFRNWVIKCRIYSNLICINNIAVETLHELFKH